MAEIILGLHTPGSIFSILALATGVWRILVRQLGQPYEYRPLGSSRGGLRTDSNLIYGQEKPHTRRLLREFTLNHARLRRLDDLLLDSSNRLTSTSDFNPMDRYESDAEHYFLPRSLAITCKFAVKKTELNHFLANLAPQSRKFVAFMFVNK
uniref:Uncharacterized protein n=1 Tax=Pristionchus pacificus TaxID=54126 RepID=A0A8R1YYP5_PRIPA